METFNTINPNSLIYSDIKTSGTIKGTRKKHVLEVFGPSIGNVQMTTPFTYSVPGKRILLGGECFIEAECTATLDDNSNITTTNVLLSQEAPAILFDEISLKINGVGLEGTGSDSGIRRHIYDRFDYSDNGDRLGGLYKDRILDQDDHLNKTHAQLLSKDLHFISDRILNGNTFSLTRPIDDLPLFGRNDSAIPPSTVLELFITTTNNPSQIFSSDATIVASPKLIIKKLRLHLVTEEITSSTKSAIDALLSTSGVPMDTVVRVSRPLGTIASGTVAPSSGALIIPTTTHPDLIMYILFESSNFQPATDAWKQKSKFNQTWGDLKEMVISNTETGIVTFIRNLDNPSGKSESRSTIAAIRGKSFTDATIFYEGVIGVVASAPTQDINAPHILISPSEYTLNPTFKNTGASAALVSYYYSETNKKYLLTIGGLSLSKS